MSGAYNILGLSDGGFRLIALSQSAKTVGPSPTAMSHLDVLHCI